MDITYPSVQSRYGSDAITVFNNIPGPVTESDQTFSLCLYTNCQSGLDMTPCDYDIVTVSNSLIGTVLGITEGNWQSPVVSEAPEESAEPTLPIVPEPTESDKTVEAQSPEETGQITEKSDLSALYAKSAVFDKTETFLNDELAALCADDKKAERHSDELAKLIKQVVFKPEEELEEIIGRTEDE